MKFKTEWNIIADKIIIWNSINKPNNISKKIYKKMGCGCTKEAKNVADSILPKREKMCESYSLPLPDLGTSR